MVEYSSYEGEYGDVTPSSGAHLKILRTRVVRSGWSGVDLQGGPNYFEPPLKMEIAVDGSLLGLLGSNFQNL